MERNAVFNNIHKMLNRTNLIDPEDNLIDVRLFGSILKKPYSECNDIDVLLIVKNNNFDINDLKLRNGNDIISRELNTIEGKVYTKAPKTYDSDILPLHMHHCSMEELKLHTPFSDTFHKNNISIWDN